VILISQNIDDVPFDLRHLRYIIYQRTPNGLENFEKALYKTLKTEMERLLSNETYRHLVSDAANRP
jgi:hypothetical protein